jgi:hypothetical protein
MYSLVHHHSGVEGLCSRRRSVLRDAGPRLETAQGETLVVAADTPLRALVTGSTRRHVLAVIVHDSARPGDNPDGRGTGPTLVARS